MLTPDTVHSVLEYREGQLFWKVTTGRARTGALAGHKRADGYVVIHWKGTQMYAHRLVFMLCNGREPSGFIDHVNGDPSDNRVENLRECTQAQNVRNQRLRSDSTTGIKGVHKMKRTCKWKAHITLGGKTVHIGYFGTKEEAEAAVIARRSLEFKEFARHA